MGNNPVVFDHVWKKFSRGERHDSLRDLVVASIRRATGRVSVSELRNEEFWAFKDVTFEVPSGAALGVIGPNGAGKSTTLKLLTKILRPTKGQCRIRGRVGALIELAAGFHPDLTGRENVFLQGAVMGMKRPEIIKKFDDILDFAGIGPFIDTPVKRYSSGMSARLGFSIAINLDPEVLVIDEVLSVGDMAFQQRCVDRMHQFKKQGVAIVFVSHNLQAVADLCERSLLLKGGQGRVGPSGEVIEGYVQQIAATATSMNSRSAELTDPGLCDSTGRLVTQPVAPGDSLTLSVTCLTREIPQNLTLGFVVHRTADNLVVYAGNFSGSELGLEHFVGRAVRLDLRFQVNLTRGQYYIVLNLWDNSRQEDVARLSPAALVGVQEMRTTTGVADLAVKTVISA